MNVVKNAARVTKRPAADVQIHEFPIDDAAIGGAIAEIDGRYPTDGFVMNTKLKEVAFVISGSGALETPSGRTTLATGDFVFIDRGEAFAWSGERLALFISTTPAFDPAQHVAV